MSETAEQLDVTLGSFEVAFRPRAGGVWVRVRLSIVPGTSFSYCSRVSSARDFGDRFEYIRAAFWIVPS